MYFIAVNLELLRRSELDLLPAYAERYTDSGGTISAALLLAREIENAALRWQYT